MAGVWSLGVMALCLHGVLAVDQVPLLVWSRERLDWGALHPPSVGHVVEASELRGFLSGAVMSGSSLVIFLQDKLSVDDFTAYGAVHGEDQRTAVFNNVKALLCQAASKLFLPAVDWKAAGAIVDMAREWLGPDKHELDQGSGFSDVSLDLEPNRPNLVLYHLPTTASVSALSRQESLSKNDEIIGETLAALQSRGINFTAVYTALRPSRVSGVAPSHYSAADSSRGRKLLAVDSTSAQSTYPPLVFDGGNGSCILFWASTISLVYSGMTGAGAVNIELGDVTFNGTNADFSGSSCNSNNATLSITYQNISGFSYLTMRFIMTNQYYPVTNKNWFSMDSFELEYEKNSTATFNTTYISSLEAFSYHCQFLSTSIYYGNYLYASNDMANDWSVTFKDFQIQGFNVYSNTSFSYASDCASFFTPALWMFLVSTTVLMLILIYGVQKILAITTLDRFDDPKGPTLTVAQGE